MKASLEPIIDGLAAVTPHGGSHAVIDQGVTDEPFVIHGEVRVQRLKVRPLVHQQRHEASRVRLNDVAARHADEPGFVRIHGLLSQLLEATELSNDAEILLQVGKWMMRHGAHCVDAVAAVRKPFFGVTLPPLPVAGKEAA